MCHLHTVGFDVLVAAKQTAEEVMYGCICRNERLKESMIDMTSYVKENRVCDGDILSYVQMQKLLRECKVLADRQGLRVQYYNVPIDYVKSSPYLLSFMDKYELNSYIRSLYRRSGTKAVSLPVSSRQQRLLLNYDKIKEYKVIDPNNARLAELLKIMLDTQKRSALLLWVPASHPYYSTSEENVFFANRDFSKTLVFSAWEMVPRMIAFMLSYEWERQTIGKYAGNKRATYTNTVGSDPLGRGRELLAYYNDYLISIYNPEQHLNESINDIRSILYSRIEDDLKVLGATVGDSEERTDVQELIAIAECLQKKTPYSMTVTRRSIDNLVNMAIASPGVVFGRIFGEVFFEYRDNKLNTNSLIDRFVGLFNMRQSNAVMRQLYGKHKDGRLEYWERVLLYCVDGNLQSVIDEFAHTIDESGRIEIIARTMYESMDFSPSTVKVETMQTFREMKESRRFRTHYALMFTNNRTDEKNVNHTSDVRRAFNSPFMPFVLASTSVGQEGLDFHWYCRKVLHWNIPSNPQDMEQREGRINRYKCLAIRRTVAHNYGRFFGWKAMFDSAEKELGEGYGGLVPYWCLPIARLRDVERIERIVPEYPLSRDTMQYERTKSILSLYRLTLGQPRQEELTSLFKDISPDDMEKLLFNLSPIRRKKAGKD